MTLTKRQSQILQFVREHLQDHGYSPSYQEIAAHFGYRSLATVHEHVSNLEGKGYLGKEANRSRSIVLADDPEPSTQLRLLGLVAAGQPIEAIETTETLNVPTSLVGSKDAHYVLQVEGDSMVEDQIRDGDYIVVRSGSAAPNGATVVALLQDGGATVKRIYRESKGRVRLQPANVAMEPIVVREGTVQVQGTVVGLIRKY